MSVDRLALHHITVLVQQITRNQERIMSGLSDLQAAMTINSNLTGELVAALNAAASAASAGPADSDGAVASIAVTLEANNTALQTALSAYNTAAAGPATAAAPAGSAGTVAQAVGTAQGVAQA